MQLAVLTILLLTASVYGNGPRRPDTSLNRNSWDRIRGTAQQISARGDIMPVWIINKNHQLMRRDFASGGWTLEKDAVKQVGAAFDDSAWIVMESGKVMRGRNGVWTPVEGALKQVAGRNYYEAVGVNANEEIFHFIEEKWRKMPGAAVYASIGIDGAIWALNREQSIFHWDWTKKEWETVEGKAVNMDVYSTKRVLVTNKDNEIFTWTGSAWQKQEGKCVQASITSTNIFCVRSKGNADNEIYRN